MATPRGIFTTKLDCCQQLFKDMNQYEERNKLYSYTLMPSRKLTAKALEFMPAVSKKCISHIYMYNFFQTRRVLLTPPNWLINLISKLPIHPSQRPHLTAWRFKFEVWISANTSPPPMTMTSISQKTLPFFAFRIQS